MKPATRLMLVASLAWQDYRADRRLSACSVLALVAVIAPLLVLFGLKFGLIGSLTERLEQDPAVREIIPLGGGRFNGEAITALGMRADVAFVVPRTRQIAATADVSLPGQAALNVEMIPSAEGDPLLGPIMPPRGLDSVLLSKTAAEKLKAQTGDWLDAVFTRQVAGRVESRRVQVNVMAVLPLEAFQRDALFADLALLQAAEDYRDGRAVPALGWPGEPRSDVARIYPAFRLYARSLNDVETLRRHFADAGLLVSTQAQAIAQVQSLSRNLSIVFWVIAALAMGGGCAAIVAGTLATIERKRRELSVLRLLGFGTGALLAFVVLQALYSGVMAAAIGALLYAIAELGLNRLFVQVSGEYASQLLPRHYLVALVAVLGISAVAALLGGWRVSRIEASEGIRDV